MLKAYDLELQKNFHMQNLQFILEGGGKGEVYVWVFNIALYSLRMCAIKIFM